MDIQFLDHCNLVTVLWVALGVVVTVTVSTVLLIMVAGVPFYIPECSSCARPKKFNRLYATKIIIKDKKLIYRIVAIEDTSMRKLFQIHGYVRVNHNKVSFPELKYKEIGTELFSLRAEYPLLSVEIEYDCMDKFMQQLKKEKYIWAKPHVLMEEAKVAERYYGCLTFCPTKWA